jgi:two-component system, chemotaxis family, chemotaxis protein CheY
MSTILVVDDSKFARTFLVHIVAGLGSHKILEACSGLEAWEALQNNEVDLVLTDLNMPDLDGPSLIRKMRTATGKVSSVPAVLISTESESGAAQLARTCGANAFLTKPIRAEDAAPVLARLLGHS